MAFSRSAPFSVMSVMARAQALPDEQGDPSDTPCFYMCSETQQRLKADILMFSKECDYRLFVKTGKKLTEASEYSKHPHIRTNGLRTPGGNLANKAPFL